MQWALRIQKQPLSDADDSTLRNAVFNKVTNNSKYWDLFFDIWRILREHSSIVEPDESQYSVTRRKCCSMFEHENTSEDGSEDIDIAAEGLLDDGPELSIEDHSYIKGLVETRIDDSLRRSDRRSRHRNSLKFENGMNTRSEREKAKLYAQSLKVGKRVLPEDRERDQSIEGPDATSTSRRGKKSRIKVVEGSTSKTAMTPPSKDSKKKKKRSNSNSSPRPSMRKEVFKERLIKRQLNEGENPTEDAEIEAW